MKSKETLLKELNDRLNDYDYGMIVDGKCIRGFDQDFSKYTTISPKLVEKYRIGTCWDYTEYEAYYMKEHIGMQLTTYKLLKDGTFSMYYMQHIDQSGDMPTHTWIGYKLNDNIYSFESSWKSIKGITKHKSEKDMLNYYLDEQKKYNDTLKNKLYSHVILKYTTMPKYNLTPEEFMNIVLDTGVVIDSTIKSYPAVLDI